MSVEYQLLMGRRSEGERERGEGGRGERGGERGGVGE